MCLMDFSKLRLVEMWASVEDQTVSVSWRFIYTWWCGEIWMLNLKSHEHGSTTSILLQTFHLVCWLKMKRDRMNAPNFHLFIPSLLDGVKHS